MNASLLLPPVRLPMLLKPPVTPVTPPASAPVTVHVFATLSPVRLFVPPPPSIAPLKVPPLSRKLSVLLPPVRFAMSLNARVSAPS